MYSLISAAVYRLHGSLKAAMQACQNALVYAPGIEEETLVVPHAYYELGLVFIRGRDWAGATENLKIARRFKNFDFRRSLQFKINASLEYILNQRRMEDPKGVIADDNAC